MLIFNAFHQMHNIKKDIILLDRLENWFKSHFKDKD